ncbi:putative ABC transport system permease protein [Streptosporangium subroseum]|uniref:Putative ABC transport system permease protein n=1 Tax=Streptosporangium subroseum TaxID=106412 RepID=A0A239D459_9ACTN|nr:ABC transporter permease [Streptosporangium subroseum]SNS27067.1 putative ABC transport system permease protein [Streptosporangium subroseum]
MSALLVALRLARRNAWRSRGRSALIMVMIGLPVLVITGVFTLTETMSVTPREGLVAELGAADARLVQTPEGTVLQQQPNGASWNTSGGDYEAAAPELGAAKVAALLGPGTRLIPFSTGALRLSTERVDALETDLRDPLTRGMLTLSEGRFPAAREVAVTPALGLRPGDLLRPSGEAPLTVVGVVEHPYRPSLREVVGPDLPLAPPDGFLSPAEYGPGWLADTAKPVTWADVPALNTAGLYVTSRAMISDFEPRALVRFSLDVPRTVGLGAMVIMVVLETVLLAGPAFAVGLRRRRRELAEIAAQGGSAGHLRTIVLADGLVLGGAATLVATVLGIGAGVLGASIMARWGGQVGPPGVPWPPVLGIAALGLLTGLVAALVPAIQAARQNTAAVLAGRAPAVADRPGWPLVGAAAVLAGLGATVVARRQPDSMWVLASAVLILLGLVALMPWLVRCTGRPAARLRLPLRVSVRDAVRHRSRTVSAVAAVMAVTATVVAVGIGANSEYMDRRNAYTSARPTGTLAIWAGTIGDTTWNRLRAETARRLPGVPLAAGYQVKDAQGRRYALRYTVRWNGIRTRRTIAVGDQTLLRLLQGRHDPQAAAALASGKAVVFDASAVRNGKLALRAGSTSGPARKLEVPAMLATPADEYQGGALLPRALVEQAGFSTVERQLYAMYRPPADSTLSRDLAKVTPRVTVASEEGYRNVPDPGLWGWLVGALVLVVGGTLAATRLAAADMRPERVTMMAIGAPPGTLRMVVAGQALYISGLGALVGLVAGTVTGVALSRPMTTHGAGDPATIAIPWPFVIAVVVGLPILATVAALITRTRLPLARRLL